MKEIPYRTRMTVPEDCIGCTDKNGVKRYGFQHPVNCRHEKAGLKK